MTKVSIMSALAIMLLCFSSSLTGQKNETPQEDTSKPVVIITKQNLPEKIDSLTKPYVEKTENYKAKIDSAAKALENKKELTRSQKKNKKSTKVVYVKEVVRDTVYIEKESLFKKIGKIFKSKKNKQQ